ncbi:MAG TPA: type VI secretion system-associated FHA domain protein TagH [Ideonella sp.]|uniref:type VI secretion system-associated FHA domain protein TagH n=1 Tax=Ideonella sp. TaxID=1929293 RepID=UPI002C516548|nr:type VI secretion system-associated FHA domain protein TagH [Ideonella sp.]HSI49038.1 type VI secretion system-associated FHA domain protein TagH [Ideonella sp.]
MTLTLRAVSLNDLPLTQPITAQFDAQGGTIGRSDQNTMALPDPERHISRQQAEIRTSGGSYLICNVGSANPITVHGQALGQGQSAPLAHHDRVRIGGYLLEVIDESLAPDVGATVIQRSPETPTRMNGLSPVTPVHMANHALQGALSSTNPFADLMDRQQAPPAPAAAAPSPSPASARLPDDFDPFAAPAASPPPASRPGFGADPGGVFADLMPDTGPRSIDDLLGLQPGGSSDPLAAFMAGAAPVPQAGGSAPLPTDPLALFGAPLPADTQGPMTTALPDHTPALQTVFQPPLAAAPRAQPEPDTLSRQPVVAPAAPAMSGASGDTAALWRAFSEGAGIRLDPPQGLNPELMRVIGQLLRSAVEGTLQMMAVRAATKQELRAEVTVIRSRDNNPLKFSPGAQSALEQLLQPPVRGFLPGPAAMADAMHDLVGHTIGTMAGTRAALEGVLGRFKPSALEAKLVGRSMLDSVLPLGRKARLWELYLQHFEAIREEAQEDFHTLFGKAFLEAYEDQLERLGELARDNARPAGKEVPQDSARAG